MSRYRNRVEFKVDERVKGYSVSKRRYRNRVEFKGSNSAAIAISARCRYRNRVEFKAGKKGYGNHGVFK